MPIPFAVDVDVFSEDRDDFSQKYQNHIQVVAEWRNCGNLIYPGGELKNSPLVEAINSLPGEIKKLWIEGLKNNKRSSCSMPWDGRLNERTIREYKKEWSLVLLDSVAATVIGNLEDREFSRVLPQPVGVEVCRFLGAANSSGFSSMRQNYNETILPGSNCKAEWSRRYSSWIKICDNVVLVDRYGLKDYFYSMSTKRDSGLWRAMISYFKRDRNKPVNMVLILGDKDIENRDSEYFLERIQNDLANGGIRTVRFVLAHDVEFSKYCHARFMRCDYSIFGFDRGFSAFSGDIVDSECIVWRKDSLKDPSLKSSENNLINNCKINRVVF